MPILHVEPLSRQLSISAKTSLFMPSAVAKLGGGPSRSVIPNVTVKHGGDETESLRGTYLLDCASLLTPSVSTESPPPFALSLASIIEFARNVIGGHALPRLAIDAPKNDSSFSTGLLAPQRGRLNT